MDETYNIVGPVDRASETVSFVSCNDGGFSASGKVTYRAGSLSGEAVCFLKDGGKKVTLIIGQ